LAKVERRTYLKYVGALAIAAAGVVGYYLYISPREAYNLIENNRGNPDFVIIDVRTAGEFGDEHIENAINLDYYSEAFRDELDKLDRTKTYLIYCGTGSRGEDSLVIMKELGFREVYNISGGITGWKAEGFPTKK